MEAALDGSGGGFMADFLAHPARITRATNTITTSNLRIFISTFIQRGALGYFAGDPFTLNLQQFTNILCNFNQAVISSFSEKSRSLVNI